MANYITESYDRPNWPENLGVEPEEAVGTDEKGLYILWSEVVKTIKELKDKKARGDEDVAGDALNCWERMVLE